jgi:uncharacterized protein
MSLWWEDALRILLVFASLPLALAFGCQRFGSEKNVLSQRQTNAAIVELRAAYAAFNHGDIDAAVRAFDKHVEWTEPAEFPGGGTYHGVAGAKQYLTQSRAGAAQVISEPERFIPSGDLIVAFVHARVLSKGSAAWQDVRLADVYRFRNGKVVEMHAFADRKEALRWAGLGEASVRK